MSDLESLEHVTVFSFVSNSVKNLIDDLSTFRVETSSIVVTSSILAMLIGVWAEKASYLRRSFDSIENTRLKVNHHSSWYKATTVHVLVEVDMRILHLKIRISLEASILSVNAVFLSDTLPELVAYLVSALSN